MAFNFKDQHAVGNAGEALFKAIYPRVTQTDGILFDFECGGKGIEVKTDSYSMNDTGNFFMEAVGSTGNGKLGGPWRAAKDNVEFFVYLYIKQKKFFWFRSKELAKFLDDYCKNLNPLSIDNGTWVTLGYLVPRKDVQHLVVME